MSTDPKFSERWQRVGQAAKRREEEATALRDAILEFFTNPPQSMTIEDAVWESDCNVLVIRCKCGNLFRHRADRWRVHCEQCGESECLSYARERYRKSHARNETMAANVYDKQLAALSERWNKQKAASKAAASGNRVPDGPYLGQLSKAELKTFDQFTDEKGKRANGIGVLFTMVVIDGEHAGEKLWVRGETLSELGMVNTQKNLRILGVEIDSIEDPKQLAGICAALTKAKPAVRLSAKTGESGFQNVYINKRVALDAVEVSGDVDTDVAVGSDVADGVEIDVGGEPAQTPPATAPKTRQKKATVAAVAPVVDDDVVVDDETVTWEAGDTVQFKSRGVSKRGMVLKVAEHPEGSGVQKVFIRGDGETTTYAKSLDDPDLVKVE